MVQHFSKDEKTNQAKTNSLSENSVSPSFPWLIRVSCGRESSGYCHLPQQSWKLSAEFYFHSKDKTLSAYPLLFFKEQS